MGYPMTNRIVRFAFAAVPLAALALTACGQTATQQTGARAAVPVRVAKATNGSISSTLSYSGELQPVDQVELLALITGTNRLTEVYADEGAEVAAGAPLALLDADTLAAQVRQAEANVLRAKARLDGVLVGARPEEIATAQAQLDLRRAQLASTESRLVTDHAVALAAVDTAKANLAREDTRLRQLLNPSADDIAAADAAVVAAEDVVERERSRSGLLRNPFQLDIDSAEAGVQSARAGLASARAKLDDLKSPSPAKIADAQAKVATAESALRKAEQDRAALRRGLDEGKVRELLEAYEDMQGARDKLVIDRSRGAPPEVIAADEIDLLAAIQRFRTAEEESRSNKIGVSVEELFTKDALLDAARAGVRKEQTALDQLMAPTAADVHSAQSAVDKAQADLDAARTKLDRLKTPTNADLAAADASVSTAESQLVAARNKLSALRNPTSLDLQTAQTAVDNARAALQSAEARLNQLMSGGAVSDIAASAAQLVQAEQALSQAHNKFLDSDIGTMVAELAQAEAALELARINVSRATLVSPFDAIVAKRNFAKGASVNAQSSVFSLVSRNLQLSFNVEEAAVTRLRAGLPVSFTIASGGNRAFKGRVASIAPTADAASRTFRVRVTPDPGQDGLRAGMFTNLTVAVEERDNALLVPQEAVVQRGEDSLVYVVRDEVVEQRKVALGLRNDRFIQIRTGLEGGEEIVVQGNRSLRDGDRVSVVREESGGTGGRRGQ